MRQSSPRWIATAATAVLLLAAPGPARAGKLSWLDDVVQEVVREAEAGGKVAARGSDDAIRAGKTGGRLFVREAADEGLDVVARRAEGLARAGKAVEEPSEALLKARFSKLVAGSDEMVRTFANLAPAEKRLVVEMGETARRLALKYPGQAEAMIRGLGTDGLAAVRVFGDDVAETLAREGTAGLGVLRKTGRTGWDFFTTKVLPNKGKLLAAGVLGLYLADPDKFVDTAGRATRYAVEQFARAGVSLAGAVGDATVRGLGGSFGKLLASWGIPLGVARAVGIGLAVMVVAASVLVLLGAPVRWMLRPFGWLGRLLRIGKKPAASTLR